MSEQRRNPHNTESDESGLLLSVNPLSARSSDSAGLSDDADNVDTDVDTPDTDGEDSAGDADGTDATDTDATDDADGTD
ncbi:MAG TPA: hypothetical protein VFR78_09935 [Pyrinomonadaceae bacterium]|nr:hypothetical protein [Pyrinomonadaceae bacterium]